MQFAPPKKGRGVIINVTSLIDVMFLLLIFFLVSSTFKQQPAINLDLPSSSTVQAVDDGPATVYLTDDGAVYLEGRLLSEDEILSTLRQQLASSGDDRIVLRADQGSRHGRVVHLMDLIKESGFRRVSLAARRNAGEPDSAVGEGVPSP